MAASLLRIQADSQPDPANRAELRLAASRIGGIAQIHDLIQASGNFEMVNFGKYLHGLCSSLSQSMGIDGQQRTLIVEVDSLHVPATTAQSLALIVNELVTNAFQHAFAPNQPGTVWVEVLAATMERWSSPWPMTAKVCRSVSGSTIAQARMKRGFIGARAKACGATRRPA